LVTFFGFLWGCQAVPSLPPEGLFLAQPRRPPGKTPQGGIPGPGLPRWLPRKKTPPWKAGFPHTTTKSTASPLPQNHKRVPVPPPFVPPRSICAQLKSKAVSRLLSAKNARKFQPGFFFPPPPPLYLAVPFLHFPPPLGYNSPPRLSPPPLPPFTLPHLFFSRV